MASMKSIVTTTVTRLTSDEIQNLATWMMDAEAECNRYYRAVQAAFGEVIAKWAFEDWLRGVEAMDWPPRPDKNCWRVLTDQAVHRLTAKIGRALVPLTKEEIYEPSNR